MIITEWKDVKGYEGLYQISNTGLVKSLERLVEYRGQCNRMTDEKILVLNNSGGYRTVSLCKNHIKSTHFVHTLVGKHFIDNPDNKPFINHKDGMRWNNIYKNLEWSTNRENQLHSYNVLGNRAVNGEKNGQAKINHLQVAEIKVLSAQGMTQKRIALLFGISPSNVGFIVNGKRWNKITPLSAEPSI